jgi:hypothetical protein
MNNNQRHIITVTISLQEYDELRSLKDVGGVWIYGSHCVYGLDKVEKTLRDTTLRVEKMFSDKDAEICNLKKQISTLENKKSFWKRLFK